MIANRTPSQAAASRNNGKLGGRPPKFHFVADPLVSVRDAAMPASAPPLGNDFGEQAVYLAARSALIRDFQPKTATAMDLVTQLAQGRAQLHRLDLMLQTCFIVNKSLNIDALTHKPFLVAVLKAVSNSEPLTDVPAAIVEEVVRLLTIAAAELRKRAKRQARNRRAAGERPDDTAAIQQPALAELVYPTDHFVELTDAHLVTQILRGQHTLEPGSAFALRQAIEAVLARLDRRDGFDASRECGIRNSVRANTLAVAPALPAAAELQRLRGQIQQQQERLEKRLIRLKKLGG